jgi:two-component system, chemotaxis family, sensor kinase Cph1
LKRSNEELERFAYIASHDLQEPLRMIALYLQLLEQRYQDLLDQDAREFIGFAVDGAARMKTMIGDILAYSRVKTDERNFVSFSSEDTLKTALENMQVKIAESQANVRYENLPHITGNENQFVQLFQNLVSNAIKFRSEQPPEIHVSASRHNHEWLFAVRDNGIGIEEQYLERIFVMFKRLHTKEKYPGTGIGLAVCRKVIEHHRGRIWAESKLGEGTTFYFTVPTD